VATTIVTRFFLTMTRSFLISLLLLATAIAAHADALMVTRAMTATTIAEIFIDDAGVAFEIEVGQGNFQAFRNLVPDEVYTRLGFGERPLPERLVEFCADDLQLESDGRRLPGKVQSLELRHRVVRYVVTGEPVPVTGGERDIVLFVRIVYPLSGRPARLTIRLPLVRGAAAAEIGFVAYHLGLPVNDFRYLSYEQTVDLDWNDPWYSQFAHRNLRRRFNAPLSVYLYVDHFEVRKEIIVRPLDLQRWVDVGVHGDTIRVAQQQAMKAAVAEYLDGHGDVVIDGRTVPAQLDRIHFVRRTLRRTGVVDPAQDLATHEALLGVIYTYPVDSLPDAVVLTWDLFDDIIVSVPAVATDEAGGLPYTLTREDSTLTWTNLLIHPTVPALVVVDAPGGGRLRLPMASLIALLVIGITFVIPGDNRTVMRGVRLGLLIGALAVVPFAHVSVANPLSSNAVPGEEESAVVMQALLTNVYRSFDFRDEERIYDTLAKSATGDLLTQVYLDVRRSLELQNQGGARVKVDDVVIESIAPQALGGEAGFRARCEWNVSGSVGHWGHIHRRGNRYDAFVTVQPVDGVWKITDLELIEERRLL